MFQSSGSQAGELQGAGFRESPGTEYVLPMEQSTSEKSQTSLGKSTKLVHSQVS